MAAPNIASPTTITAKTAALSSIAGSTATVLLSNAASSGKAMQITSIYVANVDGTNACAVTVKLHSEDDGGGTGRAICSTVDVPADSTLVVVAKDSPVWLEEDRSITVTASASNDLEVICSYIEIS